MPSINVFYLLRKNEVCKLSKIGFISPLTDNEGSTVVKNSQCMESLISWVHNTIGCFSYKTASQLCLFPTWQEYSIKFWSESQRNSGGKEIEPGVVTRARGRTYLPVTMAIDYSEALPGQNLC
jgi:hypothetical protein